MLDCQLGQDVRRVLYCNTVGDILFLGIFVITFLWVFGKSFWALWKGQWTFAIWLCWHLHSDPTPAANQVGPDEHGVLYCNTVGWGIPFTISQCFIPWAFAKIFRAHGRAFWIFTKSAVGAYLKHNDGWFQFGAVMLSELYCNTVGRDVLSR